MLRAAWLATVVHALASVALGHTVWHVDGLNCPGPGSGTGADPFCTIQAGIDAASPGDTVIVADGTYAGPGNRDLDFGGTDISLLAANGPEACVIAAGGSTSSPHRCFVFTHGETRDSAVVGFTISGGRGHNDGGGIYCNGASPTIRNCVITGNRAESNGGGMACKYDADALVVDCSFVGNALVGFGAGGGFSGRDAQPTIRRCVFEDNHAGFGSGMHLRDSSAVVDDCTFTSNVSRVYGGGLVGMRSQVTVQTCRFVENEAAVGGAVVVQGADMLLVDCLFTENTAEIGGGGVALVDASTAALRNCLLLQNTVTLGSGGGLYASNEGNASLIGCLIAGNHAADMGGGVALHTESAAYLTNSTVTQNRSLTAGGGISVFVPSPIPEVLGRCDLENSIVWDNEDPSGFGEESQCYGAGVADYRVAYCNIQGIDELAGPTSFAADPQFVDPGYWDDNGTPTNLEDDTWVAGDYRVGGSSFCIDSGNPGTVARQGETDLAGQPRIHCFRVDMGAYEWQEGSCDPPALVFASSVPADGETLCRLNRNAIELTFQSLPSSFPSYGHIVVQELLTDCTDYGEDLTDSFEVFSEGNTVTLIDVGSSLTHGQWYSIRSGGPWADDVAFEIFLGVAVGDANNDGMVMFNDLSLINTGVPSFDASPTTRFDINGDGMILPGDLSVANAYVPFTMPPLPCP